MLALGVNGEKLSTSLPAIYWMQCVEHVWFAPPADAAQTSTFGEKFFLHGLCPFQPLA